MARRKPGNGQRTPSDAPKGSRRGRRGPAGPPFDPGVLGALQDDIEKLREEAAIQFTRMAQLQAQLDVALKELAGIGRRKPRDQEN